MSHRGFVLVLAVAAAPAVAAQDLPHVCASVEKVTVGQWASYAGSGGQVNGVLRLAIVDSERHGDTTLYWFEVAHSPTKDAEPDQIWQVLLPGFGTGVNDVRGLIMKLGAAPPLRLDAMLPLMSGRLEQASPVLEFAQRCVGAQTVGWETIVVPAGRIRALHARDPDGFEAWVSADVPFGFVRLQTAEGGQVVLTARGTDATSSLANALRHPGGAAPGP